MINISERARTLIVQIAGDIDHHTADGIKNKIDTAYSRRNAKNLLFDFEKVTFMDSSGIGMIIGRYKNVEKQGGQLSIANINKDMCRIFEFSGLPKIIRTFDGVDSALNALSSNASSREGYK